MPLRRWCPRHLNLAALVIGSIAPDFGYLMDRRRVVPWSHSFWAGGLGFCLPVGLVLFLMFRGARRFAVNALPDRYGLMLGPMACERMPPMPRVLLSVLIGAWTHILLDSATHAEGWITRRFPALDHVLFVIAGQDAKVFQVLYYGFTFLGFAYLAVCFQRWFERTRGVVVKQPSATIWAFALVISCILLLACVFGRRAL